MEERCACCKMQRASVSIAAISCSLRPIDLSLLISNTWSGVGANPPYAVRISGPALEDQGDPKRATSNGSETWS
jgi:hypothetical protein